jgi:hypothetical protein
MHAAKPIFEILLVLRFHPGQMPAQRFGQVQRKHRDAIFAAFGVAHRDLAESKINVFYPVRYLRNLVLMYRLPQADFKYFSR